MDFKTRMMPARFWPASLLTGRSFQPLPTPLRRTDRKHQLAPPGLHRHHLLGFHQRKQLISQLLDLPPQLPHAQRLVKPAQFPLAPGRSGPIPTAVDTASAARRICAESCLRSAPSRAVSWTVGRSSCTAGDGRTAPVTHAIPQWYRTVGSPPLCGHASSCVVPPTRYRFLVRP